MQLDIRVREQLTRLLASEQFRNAQSLRALLIYLTTKLLSGEARDLKEYTVGVEAFGKPADYNPQVDASVRVQASKLRQKLEEYYRTEGVNDEVVVEFPKGHFELRVQLHENRRDGAPAPADAPREGTPAPLDLSRKWRLTSYVLAGALLVALCLGGYAAFLARRPAPPMDASWSPELALLWEPYLASPRPILLSLGTPLFLRYDRLWVRSPDLNEGDNPGKVALLPPWEGKPAPVPSYIYTGIGEAHGAFLLARLLLGHKPDVSLKRSSSISWEDIKNHNVVFIGSPKFNPQLKNLPLVQDFVIEAGAIHNLHPLPGEAAVYGNVVVPDQPTSIEDHALITRVPGLNGRGEMMILGANSTQGTWAAVEYITQGEHAAELVHRLRLPSGKLPDAYQVVVKAKFNHEVPVEISYVTHHVLANGGKGSPDGRQVATESHAHRQSAPAGAPSARESNQ